MLLSIFLNSGIYEISLPVRETRSSYKNKKPWLTESMNLQFKRKTNYGWDIQNIDLRILEFSTMNINNKKE